MESSEDDAGLATSASRRASARETDTGQTEDVEPAREPLYGPPAPAASCRTPAMSEDTDGDSVASPSQQDVNTSTEAILDMIDEFVDGPGAPRRLPLSANRPPSDANESATVPDTEPQQQTDKTLERPRTPSPTSIVRSGILSESTPIKQVESVHSEVSLCANTSKVSPTPTSSVSVDKTESSNCQTENSSVICAEPKPVVRSDSPSSSVQTVPNVISSECEQSNRTINVTSSDNKDNVTVERAESTSSECSVSEGRGLPVEPSSRSPLRRRLVRPAPSDRRPDCTVSSTVHSQSTDTHSPQPPRSEVLVKDVSSSSDAVALHGNLKPDEISNVSEISICKAETSTAPKKIRLVRPKITPMPSNSVKTPEALSSEKEQCQSTSCDERASSCLTESLISRVGSPKPNVHDSISTNNCLSEKVFSQPEGASDVKISEEVNDREENSQSDATSSVGTDTTSKASNNLQSEKFKVSEDQLPKEPQPFLEPSINCCDEMATAKSINILTEVLEATESSSKVIKSEIQSTISKQELEIESSTKILESKEVQSEQLESTKGQSKEVQSEQLGSTKGQSKDLKLIGLESKVSKDSIDFIPLKMKEKKMEPSELPETKHVQSQELELKQVESINHEPEQTLLIKKATVLQSGKLVEIDSQVESNKLETKAKDIKTIPMESKPTIEIQTKELKQKLEVHTVVPEEVQSIVSKPAEEIKTMELKLVPEIATEESSSEMKSKQSEPTEAIHTIESNPVDIKTEFEPVETQSESDRPKIQTTESKTIALQTDSEQTGIQKAESNPVEVQTESESEPPKIQPTISKPINIQTESEQAVIETESESAMIQTELKPTVIQPIESKSMDNQSESKAERILSINSLEIQKESELINIRSESEPEPAELQTIISKSLSIHSQAVNKTPKEPVFIENKSDILKNKAESEVSKLPKLHPEITDSQNKYHELQSNEIKTVDAPPKIDLEVLSKELDLTEPKPINLELDKSKNQCHEATTNSLDEEKKLPPIKLTLTKVSRAGIPSNDVETQSISNKANAASTSQDKQVSSLNSDITDCDSSVKLNPAEAFREQKKVPPIKLNLTTSDHNSSLHTQEKHQKSYAVEDKCDSSKQVPKLTIKLGTKQVEEIKSPIPKLTIKPIRPPTETEDSFDNSPEFPSVTKLNIKPVVKPVEIGDIAKHADQDAPDQIPNVTKLNIKPIPKPAEKINDIHRKSSSSEISESEYSENDESPSTSDHASASDQGPPDAVPKLTIKLGKPGTESEGKFYTEKNVPKLTIKGLQQQNENDEKDMKLKLVISQSENIPTEKVPKLTIKAVTKSDSPQLSPKLTIKPIKPLENDTEIPKLKISSDLYCSSEIKENMHVPKITIKTVTKPDSEIGSKTPKKTTLMCDSSDHNIPIVTKLNIKPVLKPIECGESSEDLSNQVPVVSKLNIKPIVKPKDNEVDSSVEEVPKIIKLNIKPLKSPEENSSEGKDCDETRDDMESESIPVVTKLNIKPIVKPKEDEGMKDSENQSSETGTSSDENSDHIPVVTKLNIKPIVKPSEMEEVPRLPNEQIPVVTKLNIKPLVRPEESGLPSSPKRESLRSPGSSGIPVVTKLNIKPIVNPEDTNDSIHDENLDKSSKNPPLVMKINMKNVCDNIEQKFNSYFDAAKSPRQPMSPKVKKSSPDSDQTKLILEANLDNPSIDSTAAPSSTATHGICLPEEVKSTSSKENQLLSTDSKPVPDKTFSNKNTIQLNEVHDRNSEIVNTSPLSPGAAKQKKSLQNCTLLKQLLSNTRDDSEKFRDMSISNCLLQSEKPEATLTNCNVTVKMHAEEIRKHNSDLSAELGRKSPISEDSSQSSKFLKSRSIHEVRIEVNESVTKPLEIITDKVSNQSSGQDSPRIILKINKTDHGSSAKIITEESHRPLDSPSQNHAENTHETANETQSPKKHYVNHKRKQAAEEAVNLVIGKRLRSSRVVDTPEKPTAVKRNAGKRSSVSETSPTSNKDTEMSILDSKRLKLEHLLSANKSLTITPVASKITQTSPSTRTEVKQGEITINHSLLKNDNCSKNGNSKLHNILSSLQAKQMQSLQMNEAMSNKDSIVIPDAESNASTGSSDVVVEISRIDNCHPQVQEMIINENSEFRDMSTPDDISQDPLEVDALKIPEAVSEPASIKAVEVTPTPRKRGRPRKIPIAESPKPPKPPTPPVLPVPALEERPQRSLRLTRERPVVVSKPRGGRGRGRGGRRTASPAPAPSLPSDDEPTETVIVIETVDDEKPPSPVDPTSSRIKLPRMTEALDKSSACMTPLSSRRRSSAVEMKLFGEPSVVIENVVKIEEFMKSPEASASRGRGGRGRGTPRGRTPRGRGRGRGGGKGATYMKETMGIYGRVCGPATTTVELFEEETCMMDDNATPKPSHLLDEDSQSSVKSSTNESSNKMKKSKFADLFDSNKVWTASDVKEYMWPPPEEPNVDHQVMMIQEQVAMFLGVKSFKRRYAELKRRAVVGEEKDYVLRRGIVTEALCDLGITAVDASDVLDIMLSDYPHKYEEYRSHQRQRQLTEAESEDKTVKVEVKAEKQDSKPEPPKVDPEKTRQDMAAAAIASAAEWNAMANAWRRPACVDLQSNTIHRRRAPPPAPPPTHCRPPAGFYPHAVLPHQYQHAYRAYTPAQLRYFPLNTVIAAPPAPPSPVESSSESEGSWADPSSSSDDSRPPHHSTKRKKLTKVKRSSQQDKDREESRGSSAPEEAVDLCRVCKLRLEANRKYTHERFLVCANCNAKLHPSCLELNADTIRKCREYPWQCAECKSCCACRQPKDDDKMLFCDLCDRGFHIYCVGLATVPQGRWHCVECAVCKSCGAHEPSGLAGAPGTPGPSAPGEWHHQTRRGPGGHKVYSHSLCTPCARAYRIGRYCPLCERSFIGPKGTMQLVICKLCDRQLHQDCVRATVSALNVMDYTCGDCRRGGITSRAAAVRVAPRTIATLFMAKRRFNKYAHRQYLASRRKDAAEPAAPDASDSETLEASDPLDGAENSRTDFGD